MSKLDSKNAPGHQVLAAAGKKALRPGGFGATERLFKFAEFRRGETVLELASGLGYTAIRLAKRYGIHVTGIEKNPDNIARTRANVSAAGLAGQVEILEGDIFHLDQIDQKFDYVLGEAILTMQSDAGKSKILSGIYNCLKPGGKFLSHELRVEGSNSDAIRKELSSVIHVNANPLSTDSWLATVQQANLTVVQYATGPLTLLNPVAIATEEGLPTLLTMVWNVLTRPVIRQRILSMKQIFSRYRNNLGYIILIAKKEA